MSSLLKSLREAYSEIEIDDFSLHIADTVNSYLSEALMPFNDLNQNSPDDILKAVASFPSFDIPDSIIESVWGLSNKEYIALVSVGYLNFIRKKVKDEVV
jgi:hypothetical protein